MRQHANETHSAPVITPVITYFFHTFYNSFSIWITITRCKRVANPMTRAQNKSQSPLLDTTRCNPFCAAARPYLISIWMPSFSFLLWTMQFLVQQTIIRFGSTHWRLSSALRSLHANASNTGNAVTLLLLWLVNLARRRGCKHIIPPWTAIISSRRLASPIVRLCMGTTAAIIAVVQLDARVHHIVSIRNIIIQEFTAL